MSTHLYSVGTWDTETQGFSRDDRLTVPSINVTLWQLHAALKELRQWGYTCDRWRNTDGTYESGDPWTLVERTDGISYRSIVKRWKR